MPGKEALMEAVGALRAEVKELQQQQTNLETALAAREAQVMTLCSIVGVEAEEELEAAVRALVEFKQWYTLTQEKPGETETPAPRKRRHKESSS